MAWPWSCLKVDRRLVSFWIFRHFCIAYSIHVAYMNILFIVFYSIHVAYILNIRVGYFLKSNALWMQIMSWLVSCYCYLVLCLYFVIASCEKHKFSLWATITFDKINEWCYPLKLFLYTAGTFCVHSELDYLSLATLWILYIVKCLDFVFNCTIPW